jgi:hypothetical protein
MEIAVFQHTNIMPVVEDTLLLRQRFHRAVFIELRLRTTRRGDHLARRIEDHGKPDGFPGSLLATGSFDQQTPA